MFYCSNVVASNLDFEDETLADDDIGEQPQQMIEHDADQTEVMQVYSAPQAGGTSIVEAASAASAGPSVNNFQPDRGSYKYRAHCKTNKNKDKENDPTPFEKNLLGVLKGKDKDADELFAMSVAESLRKLSDNSKAHAKVKIQQVLLEAEFPTVASNTPLPLPLPVVSHTPARPAPMTPLLYQNVNTISHIASNASYSCGGGENLMATAIPAPTASMYEWGEGNI